MKKSDGLPNKTRNFAFIVNYGTEYRNFFIGNLAKKLGTNAKTLVFKRDIKSSLFDEFARLYEIDLIPVSRGFFEKKRHFLEQLFQAIRQSRMRLKKIGLFKNYNQKTNKVTVKDLVKGNVLVYRVMKFLVLTAIPRHYRDDRLANLFKEHGVTDIVISGYSSTGCIAFALNAIANRINVWTLVNSWKDFYINEFVPFVPTKMFVWNEKMKTNYLTFNSQLQLCDVISAGNPAFDRFYKYTPNQSRSHYEQKYNFPISRPFFLYTMLDPIRYAAEAEVISLIAKALFEKFGKETPIILVKKNPFDSDKRVDKYFEACDCVRVLEHYSERSKENDFFVQSADGEAEWTDLVYYSQVVIGAASTVALEAIMMQRPFLTIAFDHHDRRSEFLTEMAKAPFYKKLLERDDVKIAKNIKQLLNEIDELRQEIHYMGPPSFIGTFDGKACSRIIEVIQGG